MAGIFSLQISCGEGPEFAIWGSGLCCLRGRLCLRNRVPSEQVRVGVEAFPAPLAGAGLRPREHGGICPEVWA